MYKILLKRIPTKYKTIARSKYNHTYTTKRYLLGNQLPTKVGEEHFGVSIYYISKIKSGFGLLRVSGVVRKQKYSCKYTLLPHTNNNIYYS